jgi:hypothetical protein
MIAISDSDIGMALDIMARAFGAFLHHNEAPLRSAEFSYVIIGLIACAELPGCPLGRQYTCADRHKLRRQFPKSYGLSDYIKPF